MIKGTKLYLGKGRVLSLTSIGIVYALLASFAYGYSYSSFMFASVIILIYTYGLLILLSKKIDSIFLLSILGIVIVSIINGFIRGNLIDPIAVSTSLVLPLTISAIDIVDADNYRRYIPCCLITITLVYVQLHYSFLVNYNVNTLGFILYMGSSFGIIWLKLSKRKMIPYIYLLVAFLLMLKTDCRNAMIVMIVIAVLVILPDTIYKKKWMFRAVYLSSITYTILAFSILQFAFSNKYLLNLLTNFSNRFSSKTYGMNLRIQYFTSVRRHLSELSVIAKILGQGINNGSGHNMFYQGLFVYGFVGTILIYLFYIKVFEMAYILFLKNDDYVALGCFIGLIGNLLLQGADDYLICNRTCVVMPFIMVGLIISRYRLFRKRDAHE